VVFAILADPARHCEIDGSGMVRKATGHEPIRAVDDTFGMAMHNDEMGDYEMLNYVVEYEQDRRIGWEPVLARASRPEDGPGHAVRQPGPAYGVSRFGPRNRNMASRIESSSSRTIRSRPSPSPRPPCGGQP